TPAVRHAIDELAGAGQPFSWGDPLVTFPTAGEWRVPTTGWHIDFPARSNLRLKWLGYLEPVRPRGGGTVVLAGSHRLVAEVLAERDPADPGRSADLRDAVLARTGADDVVELTGEPGDVVFMHPHVFHAPAPNHTDEPRLMLTGGLAG
ncbi:MAG: phytanoyl-CoA dioxygenase family protein, partial [Actinophytocola sp.]|uniref:phytanoyl-CoA dioxygenase family protein n=1 Tax=Actinophytocola sp. TaxID=1872138 RepID=UPI003D6ABE4B